MLRLKILFTGLLFYWALQSHAQTSFISGIINFYTAVDSVKMCQKRLQVQNTVNFVAGDRVLLIQMQGASIVNLNTSLFGTVLFYNECGNYEFNTIQSVSGNFIYLKYAITRTYDVSNKVQLVKVPVYQNATVFNDVVGQPWNGSTGGIIAMEVNGTLSLTSDINANAIGFRGGATNTTLVPYNFSNCGFTDYFTDATTGNGAQKGEGIAAYITNSEYARGAQANGGGGGNQINSGGAGGGNASIGGNGGDQMSACPGGVQGGQGGKALAYSNANNKVFMGGGGGAGHQDNSIQATDGKAGGGIIFIKANTLSGNGYKIRANGEDQTLIAGLDGAGGGGGGGTILLEVNSYTSNVDVNVKGGDGGTVNNNNPNCHGPGGGGGGGLIWYSGLGALPAAITPNLAGGIAGVFINAASSCNNSNAGAQNGSAGTTLNGLQMVYDNIPSLIYAGKDTVVCTGAAITLHATSGGTNYTWTPAGAFVNANVQNPVVPSVTATTTYAVAATNQYGCVEHDTIRVVTSAAAHAIVSGDATLCNGGTVALSAGGGDTYTWYPPSGLNTTTASSVIANPSATTTYQVYVSNSGSGCGADTGYIVVTVANSPTVVAGPTIYLPKGSTAVIPATSSNTTASTTYSWTPNLFLSSANVLNPTTAATASITYHIVVSNGQNCDASDSVEVILTDADIIVMNAFSPDNDGANDVFKILNAGFSGPFRMDIYDRWGEIVFTTTDPTIGWDGTFKGSKLPIDAYTYMITYQVGQDKTNRFKKGTVTLLRGH